MLRDQNLIKYVEITVTLHSCVSDVDTLVKEIKDYLISKLQPDFNSDIEVEDTTRS